MKPIYTFIVVFVMTAMLASCGLKPDTIKNAFVSHAAFPSLAVAVQSCISDRPDVQAAITPAWNRTFDKWVATKNLKPDMNLLNTLAGSPAELAEAELDALLIEATIIESGLDCGTYVRTEWGRIKVTFSEIKTAAASNQRFVAVVKYSTLLSAILQGEQSGKVDRMPTQ